MAFHSVHASSAACPSATTDSTLVSDQQRVQPTISVGDQVGALARLGLDRAKDAVKVGVDEHVAANNAELLPAGLERGDRLRRRECGARRFRAERDPDQSRVPVLSRRAGRGGRSDPTRAGTDRAGKRWPRDTRHTGSETARRRNWIERVGHTRSPIDGQHVKRTVRIFYRFPPNAFNGFRSGIARRYAALQYGCCSQLREPQPNFCSQIRSHNGIANRKCPRPDGLTPGKQ